MLKKENRLLKNKDFARVLRCGRAAPPSRYFLLKYSKNDGLANRFGFTVSLKVSKKAVERNRLKRRMREIVRRRPEFLTGGYDVVFLMRNHALSLDFGALEAEVLRILKNALK